MPYQPGASYFQNDSRFSAKNAAGGRGNWSQYLAGDGSKITSALSALDTQTPTPSSSNEIEEKALAQQAEATPLQQWQEGLGRNMQQFGTSMELGYGGLNATQQVQQAKEMASLQAQSAQQGAMFSSISAGLGALGSIGGALQSGGGGSSFGVDNAGLFSAAGSNLSGTGALRVPLSGWNVTTPPSS